jgi:hypothetical protein
MRARIGCLGLVLFWLVLGQGNPLLAAEVNSSATKSKAKTLEDLIGDLQSRKTQVRGRGAWHGLPHVSPCRRLSGPVAPATGRSFTVRGAMRCAAKRDCSRSHAAGASGS